MRILLVLAAAMAVAAPASAQDYFSTSPDGGFTTCGGGSCFQAGPQGYGSWSPDGGYFVGQEGGYQTWDGDVIVVPTAPPIIVPSPDDPGE